MYEPIFYNAKADIKGGKKYPNISGEVFFKETKLGILITVKLADYLHLKINVPEISLGFIYMKELHVLEIVKMNLQTVNHITIQIIVSIHFTVVIYHLYLKTMVLHIVVF